MKKTHTHKSWSGNKKLNNHFYRSKHQPAWFFHQPRSCDWDEDKRDKQELKHGTLNAKRGYLITENYRGVKLMKRCWNATHVGGGSSQSKVCTVVQTQTRLQSTLEPFPLLLNIFPHDWPQWGGKEKKGNSVWQAAESDAALLHKAAHMVIKPASGPLRRENKRMTKCSPCPLSFSWSLLPRLLRHSYASCRED